MNHRTPALEVQLTQIDHCLIAPDDLDNTTLPKVPVLSIYGSSSLGQKCCLHIHRVYPYFFVEYTGKMNPGSGERYTLCSRIAEVDHCQSETLHRPLNRLANYAIAVSLKRNPQSPK